jgi:hypothetical protein
MMWSFVLAGIGIFGLWLAGRQMATGWLIGMMAQVLWAIYAVATTQYGFLLSCVGYGWVYFKNYRCWRSERTSWLRDYYAGLQRVAHAEPESHPGYSRFDTWLIELMRRAKEFGDGRNRLS